MKLFLLFCFAVFFFAGCNRSDKSGQVSGPKDPSKVNQQRAKPIPEPIAKEISTALVMLKEMSSIYKSVAVVAGGNQIDRSAPEKHKLVEDKNVMISKNVFRVLSDLFSASYEDQGQKKDLTQKGKTCKGGVGEIATQEMSDGVRKYYLHEFRFVPCQNPNGAITLGTLKKMADNSWFFTFSVKGLFWDSASPLSQVAGASPYGILSSYILTRADGSGCQVSFNGKEKFVDQFQCTVLTVDVKSSNEVRPRRAVLFNNVQYVRESDPQVKVEGTFNDYSVDPAEALKLSLVVPKVDAIRVDLHEQESAENAVKDIDKSATDNSHPLPEAAAPVAPQNGDSANVQPGPADGKGKLPEVAEEKAPSGDADPQQTQVQPQVQQQQQAPKPQ